MKKAWVGWSVVIIFMVAFVFLWVYNSNLKTKYNQEIAFNVSDFRSSQQHNIQMYEILLALQKSNLSDKEEINNLHDITKDFRLFGRPMIPALSEDEYMKFNKLQDSLMTSLKKSLENPSPEEIQQFEQDLNRYKEFFTSWEDQVNQCAHIGEFCVDMDIKFYQP